MLCHISRIHVCSFWAVFSMKQFEHVATRCSEPSLDVPPWHTEHCSAVISISHTAWDVCWLQLLWLNDATVTFSSAQPANCLCRTQVCVLSNAVACWQFHLNTVELTSCQWRAVGGETVGILTFVEIGSCLSRIDIVGKNRLPPSFTCERRLN